MKRLFLLHFLILQGIVLLITMPAYSQLIRLPVDSVINRIVRARGGIERIESIKSLKMEGTITMQNTEASLSMYLKRPGKIRLEAAVGTDTLIQAYDGVTVWAVLPQQGQTRPQRLPSSQQAELRQQADIDGPLIHSAQKGITVTFEDTTSSPDGLEYRLKLTRKSGSESYLYVDANSYHTVKETTLRKIQTNGTPPHDQVVSIILQYSDYENVQGVSFPFRIETYLNGDLLSDMSLRNIIVNPPLPDSLFTYPETTKQ